MTTLREAAQQALDRLRLYYYGSGFAEDADCITALEAALAQQAEPKGGGNLPPPLQGKPVQEPVAVHQFRKQYCANWYDGHPDHTDGGGPYEERTLYTAPPQRKPLTKEEIVDLCDRVPDFDIGTHDLIEFARAIEKAHGIGEQP